MPMNKAKAVAFIRHCAHAKPPAQDRERSVEVIETQLVRVDLQPHKNHNGVISVGDNNAYNVDAQEYS